MATQVTLIGNVGGAPERRTTTKGDAYARFRIASNERRTDEHGKWIDGNTSWYDVQVYGVLGENVLASVGQGERVVVHGELTINDWTASDGSRHTTARVRASSVGHDLLFGTTSFNRVRRQPVQAPPVEPRPAPETDRSDVWSAPLETPGAPEGGELVSAGAFEETPF